LIQRYFDEPYRFIAPHRGTFWPGLVSLFLPFARSRLSVPKMEYRGIDRLTKSLAAGHAAMVNPNHSRFADAAVTGYIGRLTGQYFFAPASYHLFRQSSFTRWLYPRLGCFSMHREGADKESLRELTRIMSEEKRPVILFPEGTWYRQNERLGPLQEGVSLIIRQALKKSERKIVIHPLAIRYWCLEDPRPAMDRWFVARETKLGWTPQTHLDFVPRIEKLSGALLAMKEIELFGSAKSGTLDERIAGLADGHLKAVEASREVKVSSGDIMDRVRRLRPILVRRLGEGPANVPAAERSEILRELNNLLFCEMLFAHSVGYLTEKPNLERRAETVLRIEETITDAEMPLVPMGCVAEMGEPIDAGEALADKSGPGDPLMRRLREALQGQLDRMGAEGPPKAWNCPKPLEL
jgi:hypothetical protein